MEILVVVLIVGILASAAVPLAALEHRRRQEAELRDALRSIRSALDAYKHATDTGQIEKEPDASGYPGQLADLVRGVDLAGAVDPATRRPRKVYFLRALPRDPFADPSMPPEQTWRARSYDSPPDNPSPGRDVFDVHSGSDGVALDGTRYRSW